MRVFRTKCSTGPDTYNLQEIGVGPQDIVVCVIHDEVVIISSLLCIDDFISLRVRLRLRSFTSRYMYPWNSLLLDRLSGC